MILPNKNNIEIFISFQERVHITRIKDLFTIDTCYDITWLKTSPICWRVMNWKIFKNFVKSKFLANFLLEISNTLPILYTTMPWVMLAGTCILDLNSPIICGVIVSIVIPKNLLFRWFCKWPLCFRCSDFFKNSLA